MAIYLMTQSKNAVSALGLKRQLGVSYKAAWLLKHKLLQTMLLREEPRRLDERVEIDDAYLGGEKPGKPGRGSDSKTAFVATMQTSAEGKTLLMRLNKVAGFTKETLLHWAHKSLTPRSRWVNTMLGNLKTSLSGTCHSIKHAKYTDRYVAEVAYRFNRRFDLAATVVSSKPEKADKCTGDLV